MTVSEWIDEYPLAAGAMAMSAMIGAWAVPIIGLVSNEAFGVLVVTVATGYVVVRATDPEEM